MFNLEILEVAVGVVFVYLLVSILCTAVREGIETILKSRGAFLWLGIRELLHDREGGGLADRFAKHPLIYSLFPGDNCDAEAIKKPTMLASGRSAPAYVPSRNFAVALLDIAARGDTAESNNASATSTRLTLDNVRQGIANIKSDKVQRVLLAAIDTAGDDINKAQANIEAWYNSAMDRVSGWYKRTTQYWLFLIGLTIAVGMNVNTLTIIDYLFTHPAERQALVASADAYLAEVRAAEAAQARKNAEEAAEAAAATDIAATQPGATGITTTDTAATDTAATDTAATDTAATDTAATDTVATDTAATDTAATDTATTDTAATDTATTDTASTATDTTTRAVATTADANAGKTAKPTDPTQLNYEEASKRLNSLRIPIGWKGYRRIELEELGQPITWGRWILVPLFGWFLTAIAATLGAPFWFDMLNKIMVIRSTVKPHEKSPEEGSEDRQAKTPAARIVVSTEKT